MPLARYFLVVGGVLLALLFLSDAYAPKSPPVISTAEAGVDKSIIRIRSDRKWPERIVFDTSLPTIIPKPTEKIEASIPAPTVVADASTKVRVRDAFAQLPIDQKQAQLSEPTKRPQPKPQHKRKIAKPRVAPPMVLVAQQPPRFGFFASNTW
jgi:hypothetical protein